MSANHEPPDPPDDEALSDESTLPAEIDPGPLPEPINPRVPAQLVPFMFRKGGAPGPGRPKLKRDKRLRLSALVYKILTRPDPRNYNKTLFESRINWLLNRMDDPSLILKTIEFLCKFWEAPASHKFALMQRPDGTTAMVAPIGDGEGGDSMAEKILIGLMDAREKQQSLHDLAVQHDKRVARAINGEDVIDIPALDELEESSSGSTTSSQESSSGEKSSSRSGASSRNLALAEDLSSREISVENLSSDAAPPAHDDDDDDDDESGL